jgi:integrase/recombinase XerD
MIDNPTYRLAVALLPDGDERYVIVDRDDRLHPEATAWLQFLADSERSPNTVKVYGTRLAYYLSWTVQTTDWRAVSISHLAMWRRTVANSPYVKTNGTMALRSHGTVAKWMTAVRSFYEWAETEEDLLRTDVASRMTVLKYFAPGSPAGGEHGAHRRVLTPELRPAGTPTEPEPQWIDDPEARDRLETIQLSVRDRFLVDLMYYTGIRIGEALSLFTADLHFGGGSAALGCQYVDPHFHVRMDNPVENKARAKGQERLLYVGDHLVEQYVDYLMERERILGSRDRCQHAFVNLYCQEKSLGKAMTEKSGGKVATRVGRLIGFPITGPHMFRHTFATRLVRGIDCEAQPLDVVQAILGHRSLNSTRVYTHDLEAAKKEAMSAIAPRHIDLGVGA